MFQTSSSGLCMMASLTMPFFTKNLPMQKGYEPCEEAVICGKGRFIISRPANQRFYKMAKRNLERYKTARSRIIKTMIVDSIVATVQGFCPQGEPGFVRKERDGTYVALCQELCREKVGSTIREYLKRSDKDKHNSRLAQEKEGRLKRRSSQMDKREYRNESSSEIVASDSRSGLGANRVLFQPNSVVLHASFLERESSSDFAVSVTVAEDLFGDVISIYSDRSLSEWDRATRSSSCEESHEDNHEDHGFELDCSAFEPLIEAEEELEMFPI